MRMNLAAAAAVMLLVGCSVEAPQPEPSPEPEAIEREPEAELSPTAAAFTDPRVPVPCDVDRELTDVEKEFLVEPGPFAEDFDADAAAEAVVALNPTTAEEWAIAIRTMVHGNHAEAVCEMIRFELDLGEHAATPGELDEQGAPARRSHYAIALDASGSMAARSGSSTRMAEAKSAIAEFASELPEGSTVSLRVYGHEGNNQDSGKATSCASSEMIYEGVAGDGGFAAALDGVGAVGRTPLAKAIGDAASDVPDDATEAVLYVVSDGLETCGGDPVQAARDVTAGGIRPVINVIGFEVGTNERAALESVADAGGGTYVHASNAQTLERYLREEQLRHRLAWIEWRQQEWRRLREVLETQIRPLQSHHFTMYHRLRRDDDLVNWLETRLYNANAIEFDTWSEVIRLNDQHTKAGYRFLETIPVREIKDRYAAARDEASRMLGSALDEDG